MQPASSAPHISTRADLVKLSLFVMPNVRQHRSVHRPPGSSRLYRSPAARESPDEIWRDFHDDDDDDAALVQVRSYSSLPWA